MRNADKAVPHLRARSANDQERDYPSCDESLKHFANAAPRLAFSATKHA
jgi:hypothetical protein